MNDEYLRLDVKCQLEERFLRLTYSIENRGGHDVYLLNRFFVTTPQLAIEANRALVIFDMISYENIVRVEKCAPTLPKGRTVYRPYVPLVSPVRAGKKYQDVISIAVPIEEWQPPGYGQVPRLEKPRLRTFGGIVFRIDYYWSAAGVQERSQTIGNDQVVTPVFPPGIIPTTQTLRSGLIRLNIRVLDRR
jgi:hypothetical protein